MTMNFSEFVGFIITMIAFLLLIGKQSRDARKRRQNPEAYEKELAEEEEKIQTLLKSLDLEEGKGNYQEMARPPKGRGVTPPLPKKSQEDELVKKSRKIASREDDYSSLKPKQIKPSEFVDIHANQGFGKALEERGGALLKNPQRERLFKDLKDKDAIRKAVILREILGPPKGL